MNLSILSVGNSSRGDDAIGEHFHLWIKNQIQCNASPWNHYNIRIIHDYQWMPEHIYDMQHADALIFIDAVVNYQTPITWESVEADPHFHFSSHSASKEYLLDLYQQNFKTKHPAAFFLGITGYEFELGSPLSEQAKTNISTAKDYITKKLTTAF